MTNDEISVCQEARWFLRQHQMSIDGVMLSTTANRCMHITPTEFCGTSEQKYALRQIKTMDYGILTATGEHLIRDKLFTVRPQSAITWRHETHDPVLFAQYAHMMLMGFAPKSGLNYYYRAYAIRPEDPMLNFSIGLAYISLSLKRQADNRQYQIQQGFTHLQRYHETRKRSPQAILRQEAEFNMGMVYHSLGIFHQALPAFENALALSEEVQEEGSEKGIPKGEIEDFGVEAAMAMRSIMAFNGDAKSAHAMTEKYLVL
jgi:general transcription factor 3C polypeptide 3 (transcription factor C subunit 4)